MMLALSFGLIVDVQAMTVENKTPVETKKEALSVQDCIAEHLKRAEWCESPVTALHMAARHGHKSCVQAIIDTKSAADSRIGNVNSNYGFVTPLHEATTNGHLGCVKLLVAAGASINAGGTGCSPLWRAVNAWVFHKEKVNELSACVHYLLSLNATYDVEKFTEHERIFFDFCLAMYTFEKKKAAENTNAE